MLSDPWPRAQVLCSIPKPLVARPQGGRKLSLETDGTFSLQWSPGSARQLGSPPSPLTDSPNPNHHLPHLLGHQAGWGPWALLWNLIVVRVI